MLKNKWSNSITSPSLIQPHLILTRLFSFNIMLFELIFRTFFFNLINLTLFTQSPNHLALFLLNVKVSLVILDTFHQNNSNLVYSARRLRESLWASIKVKTITE